MTVMAADLPRRRRSSFSEHFQRVFHVDRSDKRRLSLAPNGVPLQLVPGVSANNGLDPKSEATGPDTPGHSVPDETGVSSYTFSSFNSGKPSLSTPNSSPSVHPVHPNDEDRAAGHMASEVKPQGAEGDQAGLSPILPKETTRKERRATKRLESERKELEKRLVQLEESQTRLDQGIYERQSRRLSKKQPLGSSSRSSSANTERPRSSSLSAFFSSTRRASRSRASSAHGSDRERRLSAEDSRLGPPSLPLILPERFGSAVSRELANRHGTGLAQINSQNLQNYNSHSLHSSLKSDDLRESWRMAEAWQKQHGGQDPGASNQTQTAAISTNPSPGLFNYRDSQRPTTLTVVNPDKDLDRERFTATLRQNNRTLKPTSNLPQRNATPRMASLPSKQIQPETPQSPSLQAVRGRATDAASASTGSTGRKGSPGSINSSPAETSGASSGYSKAYKSSPLAMNPNPAQRSENKAPVPTYRPQVDQVPIPKPLRIVHPQQYQYAEPRGRFQSGVASSPQPRPNTIHGTPTASADAGSQNTSAETRRSPRVIPPLKHPGRRSTSIDRTSKPVDTEAWNGSNMPASSSQGSSEVNTPQPSPRVVSDNILAITRGSGHVRSQSDQSSRASSYDTADEEVLDVPAKRNILPQTTEPTRSASLGASEQATPGKEHVKAVSFPNVPSPTSGPLHLLKRKPLQKLKMPHKDEVISKMFVICCQCRYWQDMPSEVYARLANSGPQPESRLARTFSRRNSVKKALFPQSPNDPRRMPNAKAPSNGNINTNGHLNAGGPGQPSTQSAPQHKPLCCWCGHGMTRSCCQGWSTLVSMREKFHG